LEALVVTIFTSTRKPDFFFVALAREVLANRHLAAGCFLQATAECGEEKH